MHVEAMQEGKEKFYVVVDSNGNFFAKSYSWADATAIAALPMLIEAARAVADDWTRGNCGSVKQAHGFALRDAIAKAGGK